MPGKKQTSREKGILLLLSSVIEGLSPKGQHTDANEGVTFDSKNPLLEPEMKSVEFRSLGKGPVYLQFSSRGMGCLQQGGKFFPPVLTPSGTDAELLTLGQWCDFPFFFFFLF